MTTESDETVATCSEKCDFDVMKWVLSVECES